jgi:hypothetical protein
MIEPLNRMFLLLLHFFTTRRLFPILPTFPTCSCPLLLYTSFLSASLRQLRADEASTLPHVTLYHDHRNLFATFPFLFLFLFLSIHGSGACELAIIIFTLALDVLVDGLFLFSSLSKTWVVAFAVSFFA